MIQSEIQALKVHHSGVILEIVSAYKNREIYFHPESLRPFLRIYALQTVPCMHAEGTARALPRNYIIILIKYSFILNKLTKKILYLIPS